MVQELKKLSAGALATVTLAITTLIGVAVLEQMKTSNLVTNSTADLFITGLTIFGTFSTLISLVIVGSIVIGLVKGGFGSA